MFVVRFYDSDSLDSILGRIKGEPSSTSSPSGYNSNSNSNGSSNNNSNPGVKSLGGLFAGGMPKLKPTGLRAAVTERDGPTQSSNAKRGPPPVPPPATQKPQIFQVRNRSILSSWRQTNVFIPLQTTSEASMTSPEAPKTFGKPTLVPKPPPPPSIAAPQKPAPPPFMVNASKPSPPPKKINMSNLHSNSGGVSRAQSMRVPRSHPVLAPSLTSLHQSQDCLNDPPPPPRPTPRHLRPPVTRPPPPPPSRVTAAPSMPPPPPPPPHRSGNSHQRHAPPPPPPPTPPTRGSSMMRNGQSNWLDFEARFADAFHSASTFPIPEPFKGFPKVYNSRNGETSPRNYSPQSILSFALSRHSSEFDAWGIIVILNININ